MVNLTVLQRNDPSSKRLMWKATPVTILFLLALMPWLDPPGVLLLKWDFNNSTAILTSAVLGFQLQWSFGTRVSLFSSFSSSYITFAHVLTSKSTFNI
ncbi:hypothetical protein EV2_029751 [Malus domestica]